MTDPAIREMDWYLRDHLFRQSNAGRNSFTRELLPNEMATLYLKYKDGNLVYLSQLIAPVIDNLVARRVIEQFGSELKIVMRLARLQCAKCFYINYLAHVEPRACLRCQHLELYDFPKKKA